MPPMLSRASSRRTCRLSRNTITHPAPPPDTHADALSIYARSSNAIDIQKECVDQKDTYHQFDLLGRAAVGLGGCRVGRFALAA
jgi:hypothetical protein